MTGQITIPPCLVETTLHNAVCWCEPVGEGMYVLRFATRNGHHITIPLDEGGREGVVRSIENPETPQATPRVDVPALQLPPGVIPGVPTPAPGNGRRR